LQELMRIIRVSILGK